MAGVIGFDGSGNRLSLANPNGQPAELHLYSAGRLVGERDGVGGTLTYTYNIEIADYAVGRIKSIKKLGNLKMLDDSYEGLSNIYKGANEAGIFGY